MTVAFLPIKPVLNSWWAGRDCDNDLGKCPRVTSLTGMVIKATTIKKSSCVTLVVSASNSDYWARLLLATPTEKKKNRTKHIRSIGRHYNVKGFYTLLICDQLRLLSKRFYTMLYDFIWWQSKNHYNEASKNLSSSGSAPSKAPPAGYNFEGATSSFEWTAQALDLNTWVWRVGSSMVRRATKGDI